MGIVEKLPTPKMKIAIVFLICCGAAFAFDVSNELNLGAGIIENRTTFEADAVSLLMQQIHNVGAKFQSASRSIQPDSALFTAVTKTEQKMLYDQMAYLSEQLSAYFVKRTHDSLYPTVQVHKNMKKMCLEIEKKANELFSYIDEINQKDWTENSGNIIDQKGEALYLEIQMTFYHIFKMDVEFGKDYIEMFNLMTETMKKFETRFQQWALGKRIMPLYNAYVEISTEIASITEVISAAGGPYAQFIAIKVEEFTAFLTVGTVFNYVDVAAVNQTDEANMPDEASINAAYVSLQTFISQFKVFRKHISEGLGTINMTDALKEVYALSSYRFNVEEQIVAIMNAFKYPDNDQYFKRVQGILRFPVGKNRDKLKNLTVREIYDFYMTSLGLNKYIQPLRLGLVPFIWQWYDFGKELVAIPSYRDEEWLCKILKKLKYAITTTVWQGILGLFDEDASSADTQKIDQLNSWAILIGEKIAIFMGSVKEKIETGRSSGDPSEHALSLYTEVQEILYEMYSLNYKNRKISSIFIENVLGDYTRYAEHRSDSEYELISGEHSDYARFVGIFFKEIEPEFYRLERLYQQLVSNDAVESERTQSAASILMQLENAFDFNRLWGVIRHMDNVYGMDTTDEQKEQLNDSISALHMPRADRKIFKALINNVITTLETGDVSAIKAARLKWTKTIYTVLNSYGAEFGATIIEMLLILRPPEESNFYEDHTELEMHFRVMFGDVGKDKSSPSATDKSAFFRKCCLVM